VLKNKEFPGIEAVWTAVSIPGFFAFWKSVGTGQPFYAFLRIHIITCPSVSILISKLVLQ
jgi:hypothetical protein